MRTNCVQLLLKLKHKQKYFNCACATARIIFEILSELPTKANKNMTEQTDMWFSAHMAEVRASVK